MRASDSMFFATSESSPNSKWMPWELGYFDGLRHGRVAVLPLLGPQSSGFRGQEYLGLYPVVERLQAKDGSHRPFVTPGPTIRKYLDLASFKAGISAYNTY